MEEKKRIISEAKEVKTSYPLEWEIAAFKEFHDWCVERWKNEGELSDELYLNALILENLENDQSKFRQLAFQSENKELTNFYQSIFDELIVKEPILFRIYLHNSTMPEDMHIRYAIRDATIPNEEIDRFYDYLRRDLLIDSELAKNISLKGESIKGIPLRCFFIGDIIDRLIKDFAHCTMIDEIKIKGDQETIEDLRIKRIYENDEGIVHDYFPIYKKTYTKNGMIVEYFNEEDFANDKWITYRADDILCSYIQKTQYDRRMDYYFGNNLNTSEFMFIIRYKDKSKEIPFQLLPKHKSSVEKKIKNIRFTKDKLFIVKENDAVEKIKEDEKQEAISGLWKGAVTWKPDNGTSTAWLSENITWQLGESFDELSTEAGKETRREQEMIELKDGFKDDYFKGRILKESFDSSGGSLDDDIELEEGEIVARKDNLESESEGLIEKTLLSQIKCNDPKIIDILKKQEVGEALTPAERKIYQRIVEKYQRI